MKKFMIPLICLMITSTSSCLDIFTAGRVVASLTGFSWYASGFESEEGSADAMASANRRNKEWAVAGLMAAAMGGVVADLCHNMTTFERSASMYCGDIMVASVIGAGLGYGAHLFARKTKLGKKMGTIYNQVPSPLRVLSFYGCTGLLLLWLGNRGIQK